MTSLREGFFDRREKNTTKQSVIKISGLLRQVNQASGDALSVDSLSSQ